METIWLTLVRDHGVPVSFIQADSEAQVSLDLREASVRQVLDAVVTSAPGYRYDVVGDRLVLFPRSQKWEMRLEGFTLGPAPRLVVARDLAHELSQKAPAFAGLSGPSQRGSINSFVYRDTVTVVAPGTVVGLLVQLLGQRPTAVFSIARNPWGFFGLELGGVHLLRSLVLLAPKTTLRDRAETVQLKLIGKVSENERIDLTAAKCGTAYASSDERVVAVSEEGLVRVRGSGRAVVAARNEGEVSALPFTVSLPAESEGDTLKPPKCTAINRGSTTRMSW